HDSHQRNINIRVLMDHEAVETCGSAPRLICQELLKLSEACEGCACCCIRAVAEENQFIRRCCVRVQRIKSRTQLGWLGVNVNANRDFHIPFLPNLTATASALPRRAMAARL